MSTRPTRSVICRGHVVHERFGPAARAFRYRQSSVLLDLDELGDLERRTTPLLGIDRRRPVALRTRDHLQTEEGATLRERVLACCDRHGVPIERIGRVRLHTTLRAAGHGFNPVSLWLCDDLAGEPHAVVVDVHNTYGEAHPYVVTRDEQEDPAARDWRARRTKQFHVSPFLPADACYELRVRWPDADRGGDPLVFDVALAAPDGTSLFRAVQVAAPHRAVTRWSLLAAQLRFPVASLVTLARIHWQALRLWRGGATFRPKPPYVPQQGSLDVEQTR